MKLRPTLSAIAIATLTLISCDQKPKRDTLDIGVLAPKTGFMSGHGNSIEMGALLAVEKLNSAGGVGGRKVELHILDTQSDPAITAERAKELIQRNHVHLLIGTGTSSETLAAIGRATELKTPFIYSLDGECKTSSPGSPGKVSNYVWGSGFTERMVVGPFLSYLSNQLRKPDQKFRIYFIGGDYVYPRTTNGYAIEVAKSMGCEVVGDEYSDTDTRDYAPLIRRISSSKPDLLIVTNPGASGVAFMKQARLLGLSEQTTISGFATFDQEAISAMGNASEGVYCVNRYSNSLDNLENQKFVAEFRKRFPNEPLMPGPTAAAGAYGTILTAAKAFENAGSTQAAAFEHAMKGLTLGLPQGEVTVDPDNNIFRQHLYIMKIVGQRYTVISDLGLQSHPGFEGSSIK